MKHTLYLVIFSFVCAYILQGCTGKDNEPSANQNRSYPNIVLIIMDTLRADTMGCCGLHENTSPELDKIAKKGVLFTTVLSQCTWTRPSIGSMLTSIYPRTLGIYSEKNEILADRFHTLAEILHDQGFKTIGITANPNINSTFNFHQGFDIYIDSNIVWEWMGRKKGEVIDTTSTLHSAKEIFAKVLNLCASG